MERPNRVGNVNLDTIFFRAEGGGEHVQFGLFLDTKNFMKFSQKELALAIFHL